MNKSALLAFIKHVLSEAYVPFWGVSPDGKFSAKLELTDDEVGVGSVLGKISKGEGSSIVRRPFFTTINLNYGAKNEPYEFDVISAFGGSWYKGRNDNETKENRQQYTVQMGEIKALARYLDDTDDPVFKKLLNDSANFIAGKYRNLNIEFIVIPESSSPLAHQFATILASKTMSKIINANEIKGTSKKAADQFSIDFDAIERELTASYNKNRVGPEFTHEELMEKDPEYAKRYRKYVRETAKSIDRVVGAGRKVQEDPTDLAKALAKHYKEEPKSFSYRIQGTGGRGFRRFIKGGIDIPGAERYKGKGVLIVDDNVSEGWTIREIARVLLENGVSEVRGATLWKWGTRLDIPAPVAPPPVQNNEEKDEDFKEAIEALEELKKERESNGREFKTSDIPAVMKNLGFRFTTEDIKKARSYFGFPIP